jgi:cytokinin trans-hydroxylase
MPGKTYLWWFGSEPRITITNLDLIKQVLPNKDHAFGTSQLEIRFSAPIIGKGLVTTDGEEWALHRQVVSPAFHHEKLKVKTYTTLQMSLTNLSRKDFKTIMNYQNIEKQLIF